METFLSICQEVHDRLGMQGELTTVDVSTTHYQKKIVNAVSREWRNLQAQRPDLWFLKTYVSHSVVAGTQTYDVYDSTGSANIFTSTTYTRFGRWEPSEFIYVDGTSRKYLDYISYEEWRSESRSSSVSKPTKFTINPLNDDVIFENLSTGATVELTYFKSPQVLSADTDVPEVPLRLRPVIMWCGLRNVAKFFGNNDVYQEALNEESHAIGALYRQEIPQRKILTGPIA